jgi:hypothetical protein
MKKMIEIIGWYGAVAIVGAYAFMSWGMISSGSLVYQLLNLTGSIGIVLASWFKKAYQPAVLNLIWSVIALVALIQVLK